MSVRDAWGFESDAGVRGRARATARRQWAEDPQAVQHPGSLSLGERRELEAELQAKRDELMRRVAAIDEQVVRVRAGDVPLARRSGSMRDKQVRPSEVRVSRSVEAAAANAGTRPAGGRTEPNLYSQLMLEANEVLGQSVEVDLLEIAAKEDARRMAADQRSGEAGVQMDSTYAYYLRRFDS